MRRRPRSGGRRVLAVVLLVAVVTFAPLPTVSGPVGELGRSTGIGVDSDENGLVALNVSSELREDATNCLVVVTNNRERTITATVSLATESRDEGDLVVPSGGSGDGDAVTVDIGAGDQQRFDMTVHNNTSGTTVSFDVSATTDDTSFTLPDRSSPITGSADASTCA